MKESVRLITRRSGGRSIEQVSKRLSEYLRGWKEYFRLADTPRIFADLDEWIRHRLRAIHLKHWKRGRPSIANCASEDCPRTQPPRSPGTVADGGKTPPSSSTWPFLSATSTNWAFPGWPRNLNFSNRPVRTRTPGGVAGVPKDHLGHLCQLVPTRTGDPPEADLSTTANVADVDYADPPSPSDDRSGSRSEVRDRPVPAVATPAGQLKGVWPL